MSWKRHLDIIRPCPVLDQVVREAGEDPELDCRRCGKTVLNLSYNTEALAKARIDGLPAQSGEVCVIYRLGRDDEPLFVPGMECHARPQKLVHAAALGIAAIGTAAYIGLGDSDKTAAEDCQPCDNPPAAIEAGHRPTLPEAITTPAMAEPETEPETKVEPTQESESKERPRTTKTPRNRRRGRKTAGMMRRQPRLAGRIRLGNTDNPLGD